MATGPAWTIHLATQSAPVSVAPPELEVAIDTRVAAAPALPEREPIVASADAGLSAWSWALVVAALIALGRGAALARRIRRFRRALAGRRPVVDLRGQVVLARLRRRTERPIALSLTTADGLSGPVALWGNEICLPPRALVDLGDQGLEAVLAHEVAHVERRDNLWLAIAALVETILFFQPLNRLARRLLQESAELASDERAVELTGDSLALARSLAQVAEWGIVPEGGLASAVVSSNGSLFERVRLLLEGDRPRRSRRAGSLATAGLGLLVLTAPGVTFESIAAPVPPAPAPTVPQPAPRARTSAPEGQTNGLWLMELGSEARLQLHLGSHQTGLRLAPSDVSGVPRDGAARFQVKRDAGTFQLEGSFRDAKGAGHFDFRPDPAFLTALRERGYAAPTADQQLAFAVSDIGLAFLDELKAQGYERPSLEQLVKMAHHGVGLDYLRGLKSLGYTLGSVERLITMRDHGVSLDYIRGLDGLGYRRLPAEELVKTRDHGVTPELVRGLRDAGLGTLSLEEVRRARDHGVSPEYIKELKTLGYGGLTLSQLIQARDHGVSADYVQGLGRAGYSRLGMENLIRLRDHGVTPAFIQKMEARGFKRASVDDLIKLRNSGIN
jgi:beta-lactamase regulating signal transducer with metallopeptidase domain